MKMYQWLSLRTVSDGKTALVYSVQWLAPHLGCKFINVWAQALSWGNPQDWVKVCVQYTGGPDLIVIRNDPAGQIKSTTVCVWIYRADSLTAPIWLADERHLLKTLNNNFFKPFYLYVYTYFTFSTSWINPYMLPATHWTSTLPPYDSPRL